MKKRRTFILIGLILIAVVLAGAALLLRGGRQQVPEEVGPPTPTPVPMVSIVVARNNLDRGTELRAELVQMVPWPEDRLPAAGYFVDVEDVEGCKLRVSVLQGMPIYPSMCATEFTTEAGGSDISLAIGPGQRVIAIPIDLIGAVGWFIRPGDHVDVLASWNVVDLDEEFQSFLPNNWMILNCPEGYTCQGVLGRMELLPTGDAVMVYPSGPSLSGYFAQMTVQDAVVMAIGPYAPEPEVTPPPTEVPPGQQVQPTPTPIPEPPAADVVVLLVSTQDALTLKALIEMHADIDLVLRGPAEAGYTQTAPVTLEYIVSTYGIEQPPKLPFGVVSPLTSPQYLLEAYMQEAIEIIRTDQQQQAE